MGISFRLPKFGSKSLGKNATSDIQEKKQGGLQLNVCVFNVPTTA